MQKQKKVQMYQQEVESDLSEAEEQRINEFILDPQAFLAVCIKDKKIKVMDERNPILPNVYLKDISLHKKGPLQDKIYSKNDFYYRNIRRGNTICQIYNEDEGQQKSQLFMCRRGMKKFYDLQPQYLEINRRLTHQSQRYRKRIFEELDQLLEGGKNKFHFYRIFKQNGQHCQISYIEQLNSWLFASKNVAILARHEQDLEDYYEKERFYWAKLVGKQFFKILQTMTNQKKNELISDLRGRTLLGEHCGYEKHQHITQYNKVQIIFYALIDNNGTDHCLPVQQCEQLLCKYALKMSKMEKIIGLLDKNKIYMSMYNMLRSVGQGTMEVFGEGSVLYIVAQNQESHQRTIGMCKLKTCEYLILRKLREMIKIYFAKSGATANSFEKYKFDIESLVSSYFKPPQPLPHYFEIAQLAFQEVKQKAHLFSDEEFRYRFVDFLTTVKAKMQNKIKQQQQNGQKEHRRILLICPPLLCNEIQQITQICRKRGFCIEYIYRPSQKQDLNQSVLHILHLVPRLNFKQMDPNTTILCYSVEKPQIQKIANQLSQLNDLKKSHLVSFIKSQDKMRSLQLLNDKIETFAQECFHKQKNQKTQVSLNRVANIDQILQQLTKKIIVKKGEQLLSLQFVNKNNEMAENQQQINTLVVVTLLIPGSGKSSLAEYLLTEIPSLQVISSDKIRRSVMEKCKGKRQMSDEQAYAATKKKGLQKYQQAIKKALGEERPTQKKIVYIDRVFCPTTVLENIQELAKPWIKFIIISQVQIPAKLNNHIYPHSLAYLLGCIKRSIQREGHETLTGKSDQIVKVILKFYQMFRGFTYKKLSHQLKQKNINHFMIELDFLGEDGMETDNLFLKKKMEDCLKLIPVGHDAPESTIYTELIQLIYKFGKHLQSTQSNKEEISKQATLKKNCKKLLSVLNF